MAGYVFVVMVLSILLFLINGIGCEYGKVGVYAVAILILLLPFALCGFALGLIKNHKTGLTFVFSVWIVTVFVLPVLIIQIMEPQRVSIESSYAVESENQRAFTNYEQDCFIKTGGHLTQAKRKSKLEAKMFFDFFRNGFADSIKREEMLLRQVKNYAGNRESVSALFPTTFFLSFSKEIGGVGFSSLMQFQEKGVKIKEKFVSYIAMMLILDNINKDQAKRCLKPTDHVVIGESQFPSKLPLGLMSFLFVLLSEILLIDLFSRRLLYPKVDMIGAMKKALQPDAWKKNKITVEISANRNMPGQLCRVLERREISYIMVPGPVDLPTVKVKDIFKFFSVPVPDELKEVSGEPVSKIDVDHKALLILDILQSHEHEFFIFDNFAADLTTAGANEFKERLQALKKGRKVVYFGRTEYDSLRFADSI